MPRIARAAGVLWAAFASTLAMHAAAAPPKSPSHPVPPPLAPLPMLPSIARVRIDVMKSQIVIIEEVSLPRGDWHGEALDFYVAFGAPGAPRAVDAQLVTLGDGVLEPDATDAGEALTTDRAPRRPASAHALLGREAMAGVVVHVKRESLARALSPGNMAALRIRTALDLPEEDSRGAHGVVIRLGALRGTPLTLGRIVLTSRTGAPPFARAEARLCGAEAETTPLALAVVPRPPPGASANLPSSAAGAEAAPPPIAPVLAVRHPTDDLCVRYWNVQPPPPSANAPASAP